LALIVASTAPQLPWPSTMIAVVPTTATPCSRLAIRSAVAILPADAAAEQMPDPLVEHQLDVHAGIGAGQDGGERDLRLGGVLLQDLQIVVERGQLALRKALVAAHHRLQRDPPVGNQR
jgi:hypothetical protein